MVMLFARSSIALSSVPFRHIQAGLVNKSLDIFVKWSGPISMLKGSVANVVVVAACCHGTGPSGPIPIALFPFHYDMKTSQMLSYDRWRSAQAAPP